MGNPVGSEKTGGEEALVKEGWTKHFLASGARLAEARTSYASIGLEVHLEPATANDLACSECQPPQPSATVEGWYVIYTRPKPGAERGAGGGRGSLVVKGADLGNQEKTVFKPPRESIK